MKQFKTIKKCAVAARNNFCYDKLDFLIKRDTPMKLPHSFEIFQLLDWNCQHANLSLADRLYYFTQYFLGRPYVLGPLGEGAEGEFDRNPLVRIDGFDCVTYVNLVLALLYAQNYPLFFFHLLRLSYKNGFIHFENRHHFLETDWNPANAALGYFKDFTTHIVDRQGMPLWEMAYAWINKKRWLQVQSQLRSASRLASLPLTNMHAYTPYLPLSCILDQNAQVNSWILTQLPDAGVLEIVRPGWDLTQQIGTHLNISHVGFVLQKQGTYYFCHASQTKQQVVVENLVDYLHQYVNHATIKGIHIQSLRGIL